MLKIEPRIRRAAEKHDDDGEDGDCDAVGSFHAYSFKF